MMCCVLIYKGKGRKMNNQKYHILVSRETKELVAHLSEDQLNFKINKAKKWLYNSLYQKGRFNQFELKTMEALFSKDWKPNEDKYKETGENIKIFMGFEAIRTLEYCRVFLFNFGRVMNTPSSSFSLSNVLKVILTFHFDTKSKEQEDFRISYFDKQYRRYLN